MRKRPAVPLIIGLCVAAIVLTLSQRQWVHKADLLLYDTQFVWRHHLERWLGRRFVPVDPHIALVLIDEATDRDPSFSMAGSSWLPLYAQAVRGVLDGGATAVGLDVLIRYPTTVQTAEERAALEKFMALGDDAYRGRLVLIGYLEPGEGGALRMVPPCDPVRAVIGDENVGLANLTRDDVDGVERAQSLYPVQVGAGKWPFFAPLLAEKHSGRKLMPGTFGDVAVPAVSSRMAIDYSGPEIAFHHYSFADVYHHAQAAQDPQQAANGRAEAAGWLRDRFAGQVVLVGVSTRRGQDFCPTPFSLLHPAEDAPWAYGAQSASDMLGVQIHAEIINTLLTGSFLQQVGPLGNAVLLILLCLGMAVMAYVLPVVPGTVGTITMAIMWIVVSTARFSWERLWFPQAGAILAAPLILGVVHGYRFWFEEREKRRIRHLFGRYVSPRVMEALLRDPAQASLGAIGQRTITVLFSDINSFSTVCETRTPEDIIRMLNDYFADMTAIINRHDGTIKQFVGDEIMVMYGAPQRHPDAERAAVQSALEMIACLESRRGQDPTGERGFYSIKIGIHTGDVIVGNVGSAERAEYAAVGDNVNLGARIMGMTKQTGGDILISEVTYEKVKDMPGVEFVYHGMRDVKGRQDKIGVYEVRPGRSPGNLGQ